MDDLSDEIDYLFKILLLGDARVGKTSICTRIELNEFTDNYVMTLGVNLNHKAMIMDGSRIMCNIFDVGGQAIFEDLSPMYITDAHAALVVYDITDRGSFENLGKWIEDLRKHNGALPIIITGNKMDLESERVVSEDDVKGFIKELEETWKPDRELNRIPFKDERGAVPVDLMETSAKTSQESIDQLIDQIVKMIFKAYDFDF